MLHPCKVVYSNMVRNMQGSFDDTKGSLAVQQCATEQSRAELEEATQRTAHYLALGAAGALLAYLQQACAAVTFLRQC